MVGVAIGLTGSTACAAAMVLALVGLVGAGTAAAGASPSSGDMSTMSGTGTSGFASPVDLAVAILIRAGPVILLLSIVAVVAAVAAKRRGAVIPVLLGGIVLYVGMYLLSQRVVMFVSIGVGMLIWLAALFWAVRLGPKRLMA